jgi:competence protein ComEA
MVCAVGAAVAVCAPGAAAAAGAGKDLEGVVNLNTASAEILQLLPGIGPAKVRSIFWYRQRHPFRTADELVRIKGIGRKMVRRLRPHLAVSGPTTARAIARPRGLEPPVPAPPPPVARPPPAPAARHPQAPVIAAGHPPRAPALGTAPANAVRGAAVRSAVLRRAPLDNGWRRSAADHCAPRP